MTQDQVRRETAGETYPDEIDLVDVFRFLYKEKWKLVGGAVLGGVIGFGIVKAGPNSYETKFSVKQEGPLTSSAIPLERINATLQVVTGSSEMISDALVKVSKDYPEFEKAISDRGWKIDQLAQQLAAAKPQDRLVKLEAGPTPKSFVLSLSFPTKVFGEQAPLVGLSILNQLAIASNQQKLEEQTQEPSSNSENGASEHFLAIQKFTETTVKLGALEARLLAEAPSMIQNYISSDGFAGSGSPLEAQFARIRFLLGIKADRSKDDSKTVESLQNEFVGLEEKALSASISLDIANESQKELIKKNLQATPNDTLPTFATKVKSPAEFIKFEAQAKKLNLGLLAGIFLGGMLSFMGILAKRFLGENWKRIVSDESK
jgi:uncharacterized protein involved in exopolysaccharide biosynthesis